jgi:hypothetical protein
MYSKKGGGYAPCCSYKLSSATNSHVILKCISAEKKNKDMMGKQYAPENKKKQK